MRDEALRNASLKAGVSKPLAVRFPAPDDARQPKERLLHLGRLLPRQWRRQVVIHGQRFWLPG